MSKLATNEISVAVCSYNGEHYIAEQLLSILRQTLTVDQIILCDDGSTDQTVEEAEKVLSNEQIKYRIEKNAVNLGVTKNFEKAISLCTGDIIFTADQDDIWKPNKVERMLECFHKDPACIMVFSDADIIDGSGGEILPSLHRKDGFMQMGEDFSAYMDNILRLNYTVYGCTMAFRKSFVEKVIPFVQSKANHDAWIMCCAGLFGTVEYIQEPLISYRIHGSNCVGSVAGNPKWEGIAARQDDFDRHFAMHELRELRMMLLQEALSRAPRPGTAYAGSCRKAIRFFECLREMKVHPVKGIFLLGASVLNGSYRYRFCDRGRKLTAIKMMKQLPYDIAFLMNWRKRITCV